MIAVLVMTDGRRSLLEQCIAEAKANLVGPDLITEWWMHDDTGDEGYRAELQSAFPNFRHIGSGSRRGFGGAIRHAWSQLWGHSEAKFVFHLEDDFRLTRTVELAGLAYVLLTRPHLAQLALRRQPWNDAERQAGGIVERHPEDYIETRAYDYAWLEHRRFFTTNPSMYRRSLCAREWPAGPQSEGRFGIDLFASDPEIRCAFWGDRESGEWCEHIGHVRAGNGY